MIGWSIGVVNLRQRDKWWQGLRGDQAGAVVAVNKALLREQQILARQL